MSDTTDLNSWNTDNVAKNFSPDPHKKIAASRNVAETPISVAILYFFSILNILSIVYGIYQKNLIIALFSLLGVGLLSGLARLIQEAYRIRLLMEHKLVNRDS